MSEQEFAAGRRSATKAIVEAIDKHYEERSADDWDNYSYYEGYLDALERASHIALYETRGE